MFIEIEKSTLEERLSSKNRPFILDVREAYEFEDGSIADLNIPMGDVLARYQELEKYPEIIVCCLSGKRARAVAYHLAQKLKQTKVYTLVGGLESLNQ